MDSRAADGGRSVRRRRACLACSRRFSTYERAEAVGLGVRKREGALEPFDRDKLLAGMRKATKNLPIDEGVVREAAGRVEARLRAAGTRDVPSALIGSEVLAELRDLDHVAYVRFASVYRGFTSPEDFRRELASLDKASPPKPRRGRPAAAEET